MLFLLACLAVIEFAQAATVTVDFDNLSQNSPLTNQLSGLGITFVAAFVNDNFGLPGSSGSNGLIHDSLAFQPTPANPIQIVFATAQSSVTITVVDIGANGATIDAFDAANTLVASMTAFGTALGVGEFQILTVQAASIRRVALYQPQLVTGDGILFDDLVFSDAAVGGASGDPHFTGANGVKFDFDGQPNGNYNVFSAPQLQINMHLAGDGPAMRFITEIGVVFRNVTMRFDVHMMKPAFIKRLNEQLNPFGAKASYAWGKLTLELCKGQSVVITQHHANKKLNPSLAHDDGKVFYYLNIAVHTPRCDDAYGGALGQTYKCAYVDRGEEFKFVHATEESFRVASLDAVSEQFDAEALCVAAVVHKGDAASVNRLDNNINRRP